MVRPLERRRPWCCVKNESFVQGTNAASLPPLNFESWIPAAVVQEAKNIYAESVTQENPVRARELLIKLISDPRMKKVWHEIFKKKRLKYKSTNEFYNPMYIKIKSKLANFCQQASALRATGKPEDLRSAEELKIDIAILEKHGIDYLELVPWTDQELGAQLFLWRIYYEALDPAPEFYSDVKAAVKALRTAADKLSTLSRDLRSKHPARILVKAASDLNSKADNLDFDPKTDNPWVITRNRRKDGAELKTFVGSALITMNTLFDKDMHGTIATLANVIFDRNDVSISTIQGMLRLS